MGSQIDIFILDFAKAFDKVPHERLKSKLHRCGINNKLPLWIDSFFFVKECKELYCAVPNQHGHV